MTQTTPKITVLIPTFNRANFLAECLDSILNQKLPASQIIVVNDGSTDNTRKVLEPYMPRIDYLECNQIGKPGAINCGFEKVSGDYLWIFDDDDVALPDALRRFVTPLEQNLDYDYSFSTFLYTNTEEKSYHLGKTTHHSGIPDLKTRGALIPLLEANYLGGAALFTRTKCYDKVGLFDEKLFRSQDYEMAIRIVRHFKGIQLEGPSTFHYRQHTGLRGNNRDRFGSDLQRMKWLEYDQILFRDLYKSLPLEEYLPPDSKNSLEKLKRQALLQRVTIMASKLLIQEIGEDIRTIAELKNEAPFNAEEKRMIRRMITTSPFYKTGTLFDHPEFTEAIRCTSKSTTIKALRNEVVRSLLVRFKQRPNLFEIPTIFNTLLRLAF